jgi:sec-independent protein translocase protein TatA
MVGNILSPAHLLLVLAVALLVLGPKRLPEVGRGLGSAIRDFKRSLSGTDFTDERPALESLSEQDRAPAASPPDPSSALQPEDAGPHRPRDRIGSRSHAAGREPVTLRRGRPGPARAPHG